MNRHYLIEFDQDGFGRKTMPLTVPLHPKKVISRNAAQCNECSQVVESAHRHNWVQCSCGNLFVDGGLAYLRRGAKDLDKIVELSEYKLVTCMGSNKQAVTGKDDEPICPECDKPLETMKKEENNASK